MIPPDALDIMTAEFITKGDFVDFGKNRLFRMEDHGFYSSSYFVEGVLKVEDISYDNGTYDIKVGEDHILIMSPYYGEDVGIKIDNESQSSAISFKIVYPVGKKYNVTWKNFDGTVINSEEIDIATTPVNNSSYYWQDEASRRIYANDALPMVVSDTVYKAVDNVKQLTKGLIFGIGDDLNFTDKYIIKDDIHSGTGENINSVDTVDGINYSVNYEQYVFNMLSGNTIRVASENYGSENIALRISDGDGTSENPFRFEAVVYNINHTVTWCDSDGNVLETDSNVIHGSKAEFNGIINVPENSDLYWKDDSGTIYSVDKLPRVTEDVTYTAFFKYHVVLEKDAVFTIGDKVDFGTGNYINSDGNISCDVHGIVTVSEIYYHNGYYSVYSSSDNLMSINSTDIGNKVCIKVTGGTGTQEDPFTLAVELPDTKHTIKWKNADGTIISTDKNVPFNSTVSNTSHNYWKDTYGNIYKNDTLPKVTEDMTYMSFSVEPDAFQTGAVITFGDLLDFEDKYFIYDDYYRLKGNSYNYIQGLHSISYGRYEYSWKQYAFIVSSGDYLFVTSDYYGENISLAVNGGDGTESNPFTFKVIPHTVSVRTYDVNGVNTDTAEIVSYGFDKEAVKLPNTPYLDGYDFTGWTVNDTPYKTVDEVKNAVAELVNAEYDVEIKPVYTKKTETYRVTIGNGHFKNSTDSQGYYNPSTQLYAVADDGAEGQVFDHWTATDSNGNTVTVSYDEVYAFRMPTKNITLSAVYVDKEEEKSEAVGTAYIESVTKPADNKLSFVAILCVPDDCQMMKAGVVVQSTETLDGEELTTENARFIKYSDTSNNHYSSFKYTWTMVTSNHTKQWTVRPYLEYADKNGNTRTIYGEAVSKCVNDVC